MQGIYNSLNRTALGFREFMTPLLTDSKFKETGQLTADEFVLAGDNLVQKCPTWSWESADAGCEKEYLPRDKQFLVTRNVPCRQRVKDAFGLSDSKSGCVELHDEEDDWVTAGEVESPLDSMADLKDGLKEISSEDEEEDEEDDEPVDADDFMAQDDDPSEFCCEEMTATNVLRTRTYDLHITYDKAYGVPRLWLTGYSEDRAPLTVDEMYEDFSTDHANKTITIETHPHLLGANVATVHPCKHADTILSMCQRMEPAEGEPGIQVHQYLLLFLKFMSAIIPTLEYDFTRSFSLN